MYSAIPRQALRILAQNGKSLLAKRVPRVRHLLTLKDLQGHEPGRPW